MTCHNCKIECSRFGFHKGFQRYQCKQCKKTFSDIQRPLDSLRVEPEKAYQVIRILCEGVGVRACSRLTGLNPRTVLNVLEVAGEKCARLLDTKIRNVTVEQVETDEMYAYVGCRPENTVKEDTKRGEFYCFMSLDRHSKLILNHIIGKRNGRNCVYIMNDLKQRVANRCEKFRDHREFVSVLWPGFKYPER